MKNLRFFFLLFVIALTTEILPASATGYSNLPQKSVRIDALATEPESDGPGETWKVITKANNHQVITVHLHQKLVFHVHQLIQAGNNSDFYLKTADPSLLKEILYGSCSNSSTQANDSYLWILKPLALGQTTLTVMQKSYFHASEKYAEFTINIVE